MFRSDTMFYIKMDVTASTIITIIVTTFALKQHGQKINYKYIVKEIDKNEASKIMVFTDVKSIIIQRFQGVIT